MEQSELMVRRIKEGTVIDHIDEGKGIQVLDALRIDGKDGSLITIAMNVPSGKSKKKDIIKVENKFLKDDDTNKIAVIAPKATINIIKDYKLIELPKLINQLDEILGQKESELETRIIKKQLGPTYLYFKQLQQVSNLNGIQARLPFEILVK